MQNVGSTHSARGVFPLFSLRSMRKGKVPESWLHDHSVMEWDGMCCTPSKTGPGAAPWTAPCPKPVPGHRSSGAGRGMGACDGSRHSRDTRDKGKRGIGISWEGRTSDRGLSTCKESFRSLQTGRRLKTKPK